VTAVEQMMSNHYYYLFQLVRRSVDAVPFASKKNHLHY